MAPAEVGVIIFLFLVVLPVGAFLTGKNIQEENRDRKAAIAKLLAKEDAQRICPHSYRHYINHQYICKTCGNFKVGKTEELINGNTTTDPNNRVKNNMYATSDRIKLHNISNAKKRTKIQTVQSGTKD